MTTTVQHISLSIPCSMHAPSILKIDLHFVHDKVASKNLVVSFISTKNQWADTFTKPLVSNRFATLRDNLSVFVIALRLRGPIRTISINHTTLQSSHAITNYAATKEGNDRSPSPSPATPTSVIVDSIMHTYANKEIICKQERNAPLRKSRKFVNQPHKEWQSTTKGSPSYLSLINP